MLNRLDRSGQSSQNAKWTSPLHRSRRDDQNAYVEHSIWTSDERDMASGISAPRADQFTRAVRPVLGCVIRVGVVF